jgi:hypothetical protein
MPIEVREVVIRASVVKTIRNDGQEAVLAKDLYRFRRDLMDEVMERVEAYIRDLRDSR